MNKYLLKAESRTISGHSNKKLRRQGIVPAVIFGHKVNSLSVQFSQTEFAKVFNQAGETSVIWVSVFGESKERPTLVKSISKDPVKGQVTHVDLHQVNLKEKVTAYVPVEVVGESEAVKSGKAVLDIHIKEIEVEALPTEIPEVFEFDISGLNEVGDQMLVSTLKVSGDVELKIDLESVAISLSEPQKEEEPLDTTVAEVEVAGEEKKEGEPAQEEKTEE